MKTIFGIFSRDAYPFSIEQKQKLQTLTNKFNITWSNDGIVLCMNGFAAANNKPDACHMTDTSQKFPIAVSGGRIDNFSELASRLGISTSEQYDMSGHSLMQIAYNKWGEQCVEKIFGDWAMAVWHPDARRLFLARDHYGNTSLYFYIDQHIFAFASSRQLLLALNLAPIQLDELYLAQVLISWPAFNGDRTTQTTIRRLPPAHTLTVTKDTHKICQYWHLEDTPMLYLADRRDYISAFRQVFDDAVQVRLRSNKAPIGDSQIAVTLSGGLDSGSVAAIAAKFLHQEGKRLQAFTSVPLSNTERYLRPPWFGDEYSLAACTARFSGNIDHFKVDSSQSNPIQGIRHMLSIIPEPAHAAGNFYWLLELEKTVFEHGCNILLTGQMGNAGISWAGSVYSQSLAFQLQKLGLRKWLKEKIKRSVPKKCFSLYSHWRQQGIEWYRSTAIHPDFAARMNLLERRMNDPDELSFGVLAQPRFFLQPGRSIYGANHAEMAAAYNIDVRDPTADARVLAFTFSVPDHIFIDPKTGIDRWLIREAMKNCLPDEVRLNRNCGRQSADLVPRLRACAGEVEVALNELEHGPASMYVDVAHMRKIWQVIQAEDTNEAFVKSITILTRGIMAGLFVNQFYE